MSFALFDMQVPAMFEGVATTATNLMTALAALYLFISITIVDTTNGVWMNIFLWLSIFACLCKTGALHAARCSVRLLAVVTGCVYMLATAMPVNCIERLWWRSGRRNAVFAEKQARMQGSSSRRFVRVQAGHADGYTAPVEFTPVGTEAYTPVGVTWCCVRSWMCQVTLSATRMCCWFSYRPSSRPW